MKKENLCLPLYGIRKFMMNNLIAAKLVCGLIVVVSLSSFAGNMETLTDLQIAAAVSGLPAAATLPGDITAPALNLAIYHHVSQVTWVVSDVDRVVGRWQQLGIKDIHKNGEVRFPGLTYRGKPDPASAKQATANVDQMQINWLQPLRGGKFWHEELRKHGDGIRVLSYDVRSP